jgi:hypothetical protein
LGKSKKPRKENEMKHVYEVIFREVAFERTIFLEWSEPINVDDIIYFDDGALKAAGVSTTANGKKYYWEGKSFYWLVKHVMRLTNPLPEGEMNVSGILNSVIVIPTNRP